MDSRVPLFGLWSDPVTLLALVALWVGLAIVFNGETGIDRSVAAFFFTQAPCPEGSAKAVCGAFPLSSSDVWITLRGIFHYLPPAAAAVVAAMLARDLSAGQRLAEPRPLFAATALLAFLAGPGLLVNAFLKEVWGRPRPYMTDLFGGDLPFVPAGQWSDACASNCSFVSGEASAIFWLVCLIPLLPPARRRRYGAMLVAIAVFTGSLRVAFGGHYLSDAVLGGVSTLAVFSAVACVAQWLVSARRAA